MPIRMPAVLSISMSMPTRMYVHMPVWLMHAYMHASTYLYTQVRYADGNEYWQPESVLSRTD